MVNATIVCIVTDVLVTRWVALICFLPPKYGVRQTGQIEHINKTKGKSQSVHTVVH